MVLTIKNVLGFSFKNKEIFFLILLTAQVAGYFFWKKRFKSRAGQWLCLVFFITVNFFWAYFSISLYKYGRLPEDHLRLLSRSIRTWELVYILGLWPVITALNLAGWGYMKIRPAPSPEVNKKRRRFLKNAGTLSALGVLGTGGYCVFRQSRPPRLVSHEITLPNLPPALDGLRLGQLTDTHLGLWSWPAEVEAAFKVLAKAKPDLVALTGDFLDYNPEFTRLYQEPLEHFKKVPLGVFGVLGNHDHINNPDRIAKIFQNLGVILLRNQSVNVNGAPINIIGFDDPGHMVSANQTDGWLKKTDSARRLPFSLVRGPEPRPEDLVILLNHRPEGLAQAAAHGCHIYLAGHTHGGQLMAPWNDQLNISAFYYKYSYGLYQKNGCWLQVSSGVASVGTGFRLGAWPEVNILTLRRG